MQRLQKGFTLIEVMIVVVIIGILASIVYPSYQEYVNRANRAEGKAFLLDVAARQERYYAQNNKYVIDSKKISSLGLAASNSDTSKYQLQLDDGPGGYILTAVPQFNDAKCGSLTLNALGVRGVATNANDCW